MENLKELITIITRNKIKKTDFISGHSNQSKTQKLYDGIISGQFKNDEEAAEFFYGKGNADSVNYKKLKGRLHKRLVNSIFLIDVNQAAYNEFQKAYYNCYKEWAAVKILLGRSARRTAIAMAERIYNIVMTHQLSDLILDVSRVLRNHYATVSGDKSKYMRYHETVETYQQILNAELMAEAYYQDLAINFVNKKNILPEIESKAQRYSRELRPYTGVMRSYKLNLHAYLIHVTQYELTNDYDLMMEECNNAISYFESKKYDASRAAIFIFMFKILSCHIHLKQFEEGEKIANQCLDLLPRGSNNWFITLQQFLILCFHSNQLQKAYNIFCEATYHKNFRLLYNQSTEYWKIYEAYIQYFISIGKIKPPNSLYPKLKKFKISRFLNEVPVFSRDKRGMNIPILIIQVLFLLKRRRFDAVVERVEALNQYCYRYLRKNDTYRSNCFIKMLLALSKANFHKQGVIRKTSNYFSKLKAYRYEVPTHLSSEVEIIPYEVLWEYVLDSLDNKFYYLRQ